MTPMGAEQPMAGASPGRRFHIGQSLTTRSVVMGIHTAMGKAKSLQAVSKIGDPASAAEDSFQKSFEAPGKDALANALESGEAPASSERIMAEFAWTQMPTMARDPIRKS